MNNLPIDIIKRIYDYTMFGEHCIINKDIYHYKKHETLREFYSCDISNCHCGNKDNTIKLTYNYVIGYSIDEDGRYEREYGYKSFNICNICFNIGFLQFYKIRKHIPYLRGDGCQFFDYINNLKKDITPKQYLSIISTDTFQKLLTIKYGIYNNNHYQVDYYNRYMYQDNIKNNIHIHDGNWEKEFKFYINKLLEML